MNHSSMRAPVRYEVLNMADGLTIEVRAAGTERRSARGITLTADSLHFTFDEPEAEVPLNCAFGLQENGNYEGRCTDDKGKWAYFVMAPPDAAPIEA